MISSKNNGFGNPICLQLPRVKQPIPLFIVFRAIGVLSDKEICERILLDIREEVLEGKKETIASNIQVSEYYAKKYLYPVTGEPSTERKKKEIERIVKENKKQ